MTQVIPKKTLDRLAGEGKEFSNSQLKRMGRDLVKSMVSRTKEGKDINQEKFAPYGSGSSRAKKKDRLEYLRRKEEILGKKISPSDVDLELYKKLLKNVTVKVTDDGDLEIRHRGKHNNLKAFAHTARNGERPDGVPKRDYFGVRASDLKEAASRYQPGDKDEDRD